uniref:Peptidase C26 n=1 Tax=mine drainage metagenome TaxID=410659 RepID=E6QKK0_9ZZZZ
MAASGGNQGVHIAIPEPMSAGYSAEAGAYNLRALPQYLAALHGAGATAIVIPLHETPARVAKILATTDGVLLPGSRADVDPERYGAARHPLCAAADGARAAVDELLIQDAFNLRKPVLAICQGVQTLNVWLGGTLIQDLPDEMGERVDHSPGREITAAHGLAVTAGTRLAELAATAAAHGEAQPMMANSSHHQAIARVGDRLRVAAVSPLDGVVEAVELAVASDTDEHWVLGLQWHPERTVTTNALSREIFHQFALAGERWRAR